MPGGEIGLRLSILGGGGGVLYERPDEALVSSHASLAVQNAGSLTEKANALVRPQSDSTQMVAVQQVRIKGYTKQFDGIAVL